MAEQSLPDELVNPPTPCPLTYTQMQLSPLSHPLGVWPALPTPDWLMLQMLLRTLGIASCFSRLEGWYSKVDRGMGQIGVVLKGTPSSATTPHLWKTVRD